MTYTDIKKQMMDGKMDSFYIFSGEDIEVQRAYVNKIAEVKGQKVKRVDTVLEATKSKSGGLMSNPVCYVCRDDDDFQKNESAWDKVEFLLGANTLIYIATKLDKRLKFYSTFENRIVIFDHMSEQILTKHIKQKIDLSTENCKELIRICENDYGRILTEIDKIKQYAGGKLLANDSFTHLLNDGTLYQPPEGAIFKWVDAMISGRPKLAFKLYEDCIATGESSLKLLSVLYQGVKRLLQVQSCPTTNVQQVTGLTGWEINLVKNYTGIYETIELVDAMRNIKKLETGIKTGEIDEEYTVPYAMISLLSA